MERQHDHHCLIKNGHAGWRIQRKAGRQIVCRCECGCADKASLNFGDDFPFESYAADALLFDYAAGAREERRAIPAVPVSRSVH